MPAINKDLPYRFILFIMDKFCRLPIIKHYFYSEKLKAFDYFNLSKKIIKKNKIPIKYNSTMLESPEKRITKYKPKINLKRNQDTYESYQSLVEEVQDHFFYKKSMNKKEKPLYKVATSSQKSILTVNHIDLLENEIYRFVVEPVLHFPKILDLLLSSEFRNIFELNHPEINIAGVHLRYSTSSHSESHTTAFHRDYNGYYTLKIFIPLSNYSKPFLEYIPSTELISIGSNHYSPKHINQKILPKRIKKLNRKYSSLDISNIDVIATNSIHRELPSSEARLTLIVTYLSHLDFGTNYPKAYKKDINLRTIDKWTKKHLSFYQPI